MTTATPARVDRIITFTVLVNGDAGMRAALACGLSQAADPLRGTAAATVHASRLGTSVTVTHGDALGAVIEGSGGRHRSARGRAGHRPHAGLTRTSYSSTVSSGIDESTGRSSGDAGRPRRTTAAPRAAIIAPLSVQ